jgi:hypothetical protein
MRILSRLFRKTPEKSQGVESEDSAQPRIGITRRVNGRKT